MRALVVYCHPNPDSLVAAARDRVLAGLAAAGHETRLLDLYAEGFTPELTAEERDAARESELAPELRRSVEHLRWAEALVLVYPTWWSGQPAMLKGWIDRVWGAGLGSDMRRAPGFASRLVTGIRRIAIVTTHGSPKWTNALEGEAGKRTAFRSIRAACGRRVRTSWTAIYGLDRADAAKRTAWLDRVEHRFARF
jgi:NAD(P)H dehydrogenase (quinone)